MPMGVFTRTNQRTKYEANAHWSNEECLEIMVEFEKIYTVVRNARTSWCNDEDVFMFWLENWIQGH